ncbi:MAG: AbrB/MazE/SpoVT family DNA-binding domain-containing protein [Lamprobacter sp.]|uniref:AbrB/MazE/SpoVT family DNA-binding domain-containing protein n=1 Tax=Lamprobacter sp. TaxID=3100796 RepID=UPI002B2589FC|nr:AbrB/MazE/SpoVT family DNA-binding domain-containing protein [Lamprobacter sp.]MEA3642170.1 AbrB/MazE/SpoVT family DNA-binding domain-containing protein [Lamprobacter sp.]
MMTLEIKAIGDSVGVTLPPEVLALLQAKAGDRLHLTETPEGILLSAQSPELTRQMEVAETIMQEDREVLRELAK